MSEQGIRQNILPNVRAAGKGAARRKVSKRKMLRHKETEPDCKCVRYFDNNFDVSKKLDEVEEVLFYGSDNSITKIQNPQVRTSISSNMYLISGRPTAHHPAIAQ
eukprot:TRINITY_DN1710_c0_g1_i1.p1 TRINITY_DN1710_c0_g1~~TRINITY_DN1710_c0_g1_i1.p1  ORF type:complete len:105 (-),score=19.23 TRINITY_DN1710_c0_g1_i1:82-396(-)